MKKVTIVLFLIFCGITFAENSKKYLVVAPMQSIEHSLKALQTAREGNYLPGSAQALFNLGQAYYTLSDFQKARNYFSEALEIFTQLNDKIGISDTHYNIGLTYIALNMHEFAEESYIVSLQTDKNFGDEKRIYNKLVTVGEFYYDVSYYDKSLSYLLQALDLSEGFNDTGLRANLFSNLGAAYYKTGNYDKAAEYFGEAKQIFMEVGNNRALSEMYFRLGHLYQDSGNTEYAIDRFSKAVELMSDGRELFKKADIHLKLAELYAERSEFPEMLYNIEQAKKISEGLSDKNIEAECITLFSVYYEKTRNYKRALEFYKYHNELKGKIFVVDSKDNADPEKESGKMNILQKENLQIEFEILKQRLIILIVLFLAIILILVLYYNIRLKKRTNALLMLNKKDLEDQVKIRTSELSKSYMKLQEEITERKEMEKQLIRSEYLAGIGELAGVVAHEIRNPLAAISSTAQYCKKKIEDPEFIQLMDIISDSSEKANRTIKSLLEFSKPKAIKLKPGNVKEVIDKVSKLIEAKFSENKIVFSKSMPAELPDVMMDASGLESVFLNLLLNAADAMPSGGKSNLKVKASKKQLEITFSDTGCGISEARLEKIFNPFYTTKKDGNGIGLSVVLQTINYHNGTIDVKSDIDKGTQFKILLPVVIK